MNSFERQAYEPPPPAPFIIHGRHGKTGKFRVTAYRHTRIMTREQCIKCARSSRTAGGAVMLNGFISEAELDVPAAAPCPYTEAEIERSQRNIKALFDAAGLDVEGNQ